MPAGALLEKSMPRAFAAGPEPDPDWLRLWLGACCCCSPETAALTPARAAENAIPPRVFIPLRTLPPILTAAFPRSACDMPNPNLSGASGAVTGTLVCA